MTLDDAPLQRDLADIGYIADEALAMALRLMIGLGRPLLLEGEAGVGKTEIGKALAQVLKMRLIRLQCHEGLDANAAIYGGLTGLPAFCLSIYLCLKVLAQSGITLLNPRRSRLRTLLSNLIRDESGVTAIEYALIAALIAVAAIAAFTLVGTNLSTTFSTIAAKL